MDLKDYVDSLNLGPEESQRLDCPVCGHKKTFSVTNRNGVKMWNCFHASCDVRGRSSRRITRENARDILKPLNPTEVTPEFIKPPTWVRTLNDECRDFLESVHTYPHRFNDIYYDVRRNRVVYAIRDMDGNLVDGNGRTLEGARPKWYRYGKYRGGVLHNPLGYNRVVVVEDQPSAVSISDWVGGYALLGTSLRDEHIDDLKQFKSVIIALDNDATDKALKHVCKLSRYADVDFLILDHDLKSLGEEERERIVRSKLLGS